MDNAISIDKYDNWLKGGSSAAALVMRQWLMPVEGKGAVVFPPTYAPPEGMKETEWLGYNIDRLDDGSNVCQIDSVGSQANRMEPIFKQKPYSKLVPQVTIQAGEKKINLLDVGHRAADAIVRFSPPIKSELEAAFQNVRNDGNAEPLAKIAPTSIVFGSWDSRSTHVKLQRVVRSVIRAFKVDVLHRSAQYTTIAGEILYGNEVETATKGSKAELGFAHIPASGKHGGVRVRDDGEIRRDAALNLVAVRALGTASPDDDDEIGTNTLALRRYILGLALVAFTTPQDTSLREGCQLVPDIERPTQWELVHHDGCRDPFELNHKIALEYAQAVAAAFGVSEDKQAVFDKDSAQKELAKSPEERKAARGRKRPDTGGR